MPWKFAGDFGRNRSPGTHLGYAEKWEQPDITPTGGNYDAVLVQNSGEYAATGMDVYWNTTVNAINTSLSR